MVAPSAEKVKRLRKHLGRCSWRGSTWFWSEGEGEGEGEGEDEGESEGEG